MILRVGFFLGLVLNLQAWACAQNTPQTVHKPAKALMGCWQGEGDSNIFLRCEPAKFWWKDATSALTCRARYKPGMVIVNLWGQNLSLPIKLSGDKLIFKLKDREHTFRKLAAVPPELQAPQPIQLGSRRPIPKATLESIRTELMRRFQTDQAVRKQPSNSQDMSSTDKANTQYVLGLVRQYGWIDIERFGSSASTAAWFLVQHSKNLPLMLAVLPEVKKDIGKSASNTDAFKMEVNTGESYAMLYDRTRVMTGEKQRYGTQMGVNNQGKPIVLALEEPAKVDIFRSELGMSPILPGMKGMKELAGNGSLTIEQDDW